MIICAVSAVVAQVAFGEWIAYPLDSDIALYEEFCARRIGRGSLEPASWKGSRAASNARFRKRAVTDRPTTISVKLDGRGFGLLNGREAFYFPDGPGTFEIPAGTNTVEFRVFNRERVPAVCVEGGVWTTDGTWEADDDTKRWLPAETRGGDWTLDTPPPRVPMTTEPRPAVRVERESGGTFADFGRESFGYVVIEGVSRGGKLRAVYGESDAEAHGGDEADSWEVVTVRPAADGTFRFPVARAMKAVRLEPWKGSDAAFSSVRLDEELPPDTSRTARFTSSDPKLDAIWRVSARTLDLCSREFLVDGVKRDRWCWTFDTYLAARYNYYLHADAAIVRRTLTALRGREDVKTPIGNILENSFYWFMELGEYVLYTGDRDFARQIYPRARSLMDYCLKNRDANGFADYRVGQWIFIDWVAGGLHNDGAVAVVQQLLASALESFALTAEMVGEKSDAVHYRAEAARLRGKIKPTYWDESRGALRHCLYPDGTFDEQFTPHANLRGIIDGYFTPAERARVADAVFTRAEAVPLRTPAWRGIELEALFALGRGREALGRMRGFWGEMLERGATSVWEEFDPAETEAETRTMYGRRFGRSLCHGWGASPVYLVGRYVMGVRPTAPGFAEYEVAPDPSGLSSFEGTVETPLGPITVKYDGKAVEVHGNRGKGTLVWNGERKEIK